MTTQEGFKSKLGFVLATAGSAVGLGNIWRFPYLAAKNGGGVFLLCYIILAVTFGFALVITEVAIGRKYKATAFGAYKKINKSFGFLGVIATLTPLIIASYYSVIGGWVIKYFVAYLTGKNTEAASDGYFAGFMGNTGESTVYFLIFIGLSMFVIMLGVQKGIEKINKVLMPALLVMILGIAIYIVTLPGAGAGVRYYLVPDFTNYSLQSFLQTFVAAMGQMFYSLSLASGTLITFGAYMLRQASIEKSVLEVEIFDFVIAFLAGIIIVPAVFIFSGSDSLSSGPGLMFETLPKVFNSMAGGRVVGTVFFLTVIFAAITSAISLMEVPVSAAMEKWKTGRKKTTLIVTGAIVALGMLSVLGNSIWSSFTILGRKIYEFFDFVTNSVLMTVVALLTCILIGWVAKTRVVEDEITVCGDRFRTKKIYKVLIKYVCPAFMIIILINALFG